MDVSFPSIFFGGRAGCWGVGGDGREGGAWEAGSKERDKLGNAALTWLSAATEEDKKRGKGKKGKKRKKGKKGKNRGKYGCYFFV